MSRTFLSANTSYYISNTGNDSTGDGSVGTPWATPQHAWDVIIQTLDLGGKYSVTVNAANGTYAPFSPTGIPVGAITPSSVIFLGNTTTPASCLIQSSNASCVYAKTSMFRLDGFKINAGGSTGFRIGIVSDNSNIELGTMDYGVCNLAHMQAAGPNAIITNTASYAISGAAQIHQLTETHATIQTQGRTINFSAAVNFSNSFVVFDQGALADFTGCGFAGTGPTGKTYTGTSNAQLILAGLTLPGNVGGSVASGAVMV